MFIFLVGLGAGNKTYYLWKHKGEYFMIKFYVNIFHQVLFRIFSSNTILIVWMRIDRYCGGVNVIFALVYAIP